MTTTNGETPTAEVGRSVDVGGRILTVYRTGTMARVVHVDEFAWRCDSCGWLGRGLESAAAAMREAQGHTCPPDRSGDGGVR